MNKPNAWIVASKDRGRKKIYRGKETGNRRVYLNNGDEFQIELHNPTPNTVMARIWMDGKSISNSGIIVRPGQRIYLERYLDEDRSFKYETYDVDNTGINRQVIAHNGKLVVRFYNEKVPFYDYNNGQIFIGGHGTGGWGTGNFYGTLTTNANNCFDSFDGTTICGSSMNISSTPTAYTQNFDAGTSNLRSTSTNKLSKSKKTTEQLETGQVAKGEKTGQNLKHVDMEFDTYAVNTVIYWLMPESRKVLTKKDLQKKQYFYDGNKNSIPKNTKPNPTSNGLGLANEAENINLLYHALTQLKELKDNGLITEEEFNMKREQLMMEKS